MKILMIGLGSIGQRHLRNIRRLYGNSVEIIAYRVRGLKTTFSDNMEIRDNVNLETEYNVKCFSDLDDALAECPDIAFICNVTSSHMECAVRCAEKGCNLFIEKPLSDNIDKIDELSELVKEKGLIVFLGFQNRFNPVILKLKEYIENKKIGNIISVRAEVGERLSTMHLYEDYRSTYMAQKKLGGGVILNQMIHEIDYLRFLFGSGIVKSAICGEKGLLETDVDDSCDALLQFGDIPVSLHADFYQFPPNRYIHIVGDKGNIRADLINASIDVNIGDDSEKIIFDKFKRNDMFISELNSFMECVEKHGIPEITLNDGIESLKIALKIKEIMMQGE